MSGHRKVRSALLLAIAVVAAVGVFVAAPADASSPPDGHSVASGSSVTWKVSPWVSISAPVFHVTVKQVSCPTDALCQAVGDYWGLDGRDHPLVETWNGSTWDLATLPPVRGLFNRLLHVSCASSSSCLAIGIHDASNGPRTPFGLRWNGTTWLRLDTTGLTTFAPRDLSCSTPRSCIAIDARRTWQWNGRTWRSHRPARTANASNTLSGISCTAPDDCTLVGSRYVTLVHPLSVENFYAPLVEHWNGAQWKVVRAAPGVRGTLSSVSCTAASTCTAVGDLDNGTQALVQTPSGWAGESLSLPHPDALTFTVEHVSCSDATTCTAVGRSDVAGTNTPFIAARSTGGWSSSDAAFGAPLLQSSVSCATTDHCVITTTTSQSTGSSGHAYTSTGLTLTPLTLTNPQGNPNGSLRAVSCISSGFCAAASNLTVDTSMLVTSGGDWVPTPSDQPSDAVADISCVTATFCLAVGYDPVSQQTSSLQWDGSRWNNVPVPVGQAGDQGRLLRVSCSSTTWCMALGIVDQSPIVLTWNGTTWTPDDSFTVPDKTTLGGVSCTSANWCVVVGASGVGRAHLHPIIATFDGTSWHHMSGVTPAIPSTALSGVSCTSSRWCMVVGQIGRRATTSGSTSIKARAFAEVWNGKRWSRAPVDISLRVFNPMSVLNDSMSCTGRAACMMTGWEWAVAWDGNGWAPTRPPRSERRSAGLEDVSCTSGLSCVGVGWSWRDWSWEYKGVMVPLIVTSST